MSSHSQESSPEREIFAESDIERLGGVFQFELPRSNEPRPTSEVRKDSNSEASWTADLDDFQIARIETWLDDLLANNITKEIDILRTIAQRNEFLNDPRPDWRVCLPFKSYLAHGPTPHFSAPRPSTEPRRHIARTI